MPVYVSLILYISTDHCVLLYFGIVGWSMLVYAACNNHPSNGLTYRLIGYYMSGGTLRLIPSRQRPKTGLFRFWRYKASHSFLLQLHIIAPLILTKRCHLAIYLLTYLHLTASRSSLSG